MDDIFSIISFDVKLFSNNFDSWNIFNLKEFWYIIIFFETLIIIDSGYEINVNFQSLIVFSIWNKYWLSIIFN